MPPPTPAPLDLDRLAEVALWHAYCDGDEYMSPDDGVHMPSGFDAYTAIPTATFTALVAELRAAREAIIELRVRSAMADRYLHDAKATHTRGTDGPLWELRDRAETTLGEMERLTWCAHDCLDETSDTIKGSKVWIEEEAKARTALPREVTT